METPVKRYSQETIDHWFTHEPPTPEAAAKYKELHTRARLMATWINELLPAHRHETDRAFEALEEMVMWATAAIARQHVAD